MRKYLCIDIDNDMMPSQLQLSRLLYEFNTVIRRRIVKTRNGYHVYLLDIPIPRDIEKLLYFYNRYGDDPRRGELDYIRHGVMRVNVCFTSSELMEVDDLW